MATVTPPSTPTVDVGNSVTDLSGIDTWTPVEHDGDSFTLDSPIDPSDSGTRLVFHGSFTGFDGVIPLSGTITSIEIWYTTDGEDPALSSTWAGFTALDLEDFKDWIDLDNADPPGEDETGAGAALFVNALFGGADTITGSQFNDELFGGDEADILISGGTQNTSEGEQLDGGAGNDTIRIAGDYRANSQIFGGTGDDTLEIVGGANATDIFGSVLLATNISRLILPNFGSVDSIEAVTFAATGDSIFLVSVDQVGEGLVNELTITGDAHSNNFAVVVTEGNDPGDVNDFYDLEILTAPVVEGGLGFDFTNFGADDYVSIGAADLNSTATFRLSGNTMNNVLTGANGNDTLRGDDGNDILVGGFGGADTLDGQDGDDTIVSSGFGPAADTLTGGAGAETDGDTLRVLGNQAFTSAFTGAGTLSGFENLSFGGIPGLTTTAITVAFNSSQIGAGLASDLSVTGNAGITERIDIAMNATSIDLHLWSFTTWADAGDEVRITGTNAANTIVGSSSRDTIDGGIGSDNISGGLGADTLIGGAGGDTLNGGDGIDTASYAASGAVNVNLGAGTASGGHAAGDTLSFIENLIGSNSNDTLTGNGLANTLNGGGGADTLDGGAGVDILIGGAGNDTYVVDHKNDVTTEELNAGADTVLSSVTRTLGGDIENLILTGATAINGVGNALANTLTGNAKGNNLKGGNGADMLIGGAGKDTITGGGGADKFVLNAPALAGNADIFTDFFKGVDKVQLEDSVFTQLGGPANALAANKFTIGAGATTTDHRVIYNDVTGELFYDANGNIGGQKVLIATLETGIALAASDFQVI
jgi:serralysin